MTTTRTIKIAGHDVAMSDGTKPSVFHGDCPLCKQADACYANVARGYFYCFGCHRKGAIQNPILDALQGVREAIAEFDATLEDSQDFWPEDEKS